MGTGMTGMTGTGTTGPTTMGTTGTGEGMGQKVARKTGEVSGSSRRALLTRPASRIA